MHRALLCFLAATLGVAATVSPAAAGDDAIPSLSLLADHVDLAELEGKVVYVDFWASWCAPCLKSFPWMTQLHAAHQAQGLVVLAVNLDREGPAADKFLSGRDVPFRVLRDPEGELAIAFAVQAMPTAFVFGRDGAFAWKHEGFRDAEAGEVEAQVRELLEAGEGTR